MSPFLKFVLFFVLVTSLIDIIAVLKRLIPLVKRANEIKRIKNDPDVISVEAEIIEISTERLNDLDTQYNLKIYYEVGWHKFYKNVVLINKQAVRVGQKVTMLCDGSDPEKSMIQDDSEAFGIKNYIINLFIVIPVFIFDTALNIIEYL